MRRSSAMEAARCCGEVASLPLCGEVARATAPASSAGRCAFASSAGWCVRGGLRCGELAMEEGSGERSSESPKSPAGSRLSRRRSRGGLEVVTPPSNCGAHDDFKSSTGMHGAASSWWGVAATGGTAVGVGHARDLERVRNVAGPVSDFPV